MGAGEGRKALAGRTGSTGGAGRGWQLTGHWGRLATAAGGIHQPCVNTSHRQLNHLSVSGLQSWWERPRREVLSSPVG